MKIKYSFILWKSNFPLFCGNQIFLYFVEIKYYMLFVISKMNNKNMVRDIILKGISHTAVGNVKIYVGISQTGVLDYKKKIIIKIMGY